MRVILRQNIDKLGQIGDIVEVKEGYALNYLIPRKYVFAALKGNIKAIEEEKKQLDRIRKREIQSAEKISNELEKISVTIPVQVGEEDKIFGSVTTQMIADALKEKGFDIDRRKIELEEQIKTLGIFNANIKLHPSVVSKIKVWVVRE
ncbi:MAG: 50S ribosomal protein L9 [Ignavibacterium sp.]